MRGKIVSTDLENGLTTNEVHHNQERFGSNNLELEQLSALKALIEQLKNPLLLILATTTVVAFILNDRVNAIIIFAMMALSVLLGFINEYFSTKTAADLLKKVSLTAIVVRNGIKQDIPVSEVVVGDVIILNPGMVVPADVALCEVHNLTIDESMLTGESLPIEKTSLSDGRLIKECTGYMGTVVAGGRAIGIVQRVAKQTEYGRLASQASQHKEQTKFEKDLVGLGKLMTKVITIMALLIALAGIFLGKPTLDTVLFALAIAIGLTPELLPVIITVSTASGARRMAKKNVVLKQLNSIENLGNMTVLCTDKTGTITEGKIKLSGIYNPEGKPNENLIHELLLATTATIHHKIIGNPIDVAIWQYAMRQGVKSLPHGSQQLFEEEFDFSARGNYAVIEKNLQRLLIFKGAAAAVLERSTSYRATSGKTMALTGQKAELKKRFEQINNDGLRIVAFAQKPIEKKDTYGFDDANDLELIGYVTLLDAPKLSAIRAIKELKKLAVAVKIITGDNELVAAKICQEVGLSVEEILTGDEFAKLTKSQQELKAKSCSVFAQVSPEQKREIILALQRNQQVVGYIGDGVNDVAALHAADVSISVNTGVDVAKDVANIVLLHKSLEVIAEGVREGRQTFANTIKYILMGISSNFGNMFSVAGAYFFFPFLPMSPSQILLNNSLYDFSQLGIPNDNVDSSALARPHQWNITSIYRYMIFFGPISSIFDYLSFAILRVLFHANEFQFQTGWFLESITTQILVVFVIRTNQPLLQSRPGRLLLFFCLSALGLAYIIPISPLGQFFHFAQLPTNYYLILTILVLSYLSLVAILKKNLVKSLQV